MSSPANARGSAERDGQSSDAENKDTHAQSSSSSRWPSPARRRKRSVPERYGAATSPELASASKKRKKSEIRSSSSKRTHSSSSKKKKKGKTVSNRKKRKRDQSDVVAPSCGILEFLKSKIGVPKPETDARKKSRTKRKVKQFKSRSLHA